MDTVQPQKRRGPAPTGKGTPIQVRLQPNQLDAVDRWIAAQPSPVSRPEAIRAMLDLAATPREAVEKAIAQVSAEMAMAEPGEREVHERALLKLQLSLAGLTALGR